jgi:hypothetical protein
MSMTRGALAVVLVLVGAGEAFGQDSTRSAAVPAIRRTCFRGEPLPACRSFWITEASYVARVTSNGDIYTNEFERLSASLELGHLVNVSPKVAVGASVSADVVSGLTLGIRTRMRYWVNPSTALDFAPGLLVAGVPGPPRFTADLSLMYQDRIGITLRSFVLPTARYFPDGGFTTGNRFVLYGGLKLGSKFGLLGAAADALALALAIGAYAIACANSSCD